MNNGELCSNEHIKFYFYFLGYFDPPPTWQPSCICTYIFCNVYHSFLGVINGSISMKFHTQLEHTIVKSVTGQHFVIYQQNSNFFTAHAYFKPELLMVPYALYILQQYYVAFHRNDASATAYRIQSTCVMSSFKAVCQEMPKKNSGEHNICVKKC